MPDIPIEIDYYLTPVSPWTYLGAERFRHLAEKHKAKVHLRIVDYGVIFPQTGGLPLPKRAPARQAYRLQDLARFRDYLNIPLVLQPKHFPSRTRLGAYTILAAVEAGGVHDGMIASEALLKGLWAEEKDMDDPAAVSATLNAAGLDGEKLVRIAGANSSGFDSRIAADTEKALDQQVFGAPSYVYKGEVFWGQDRLDLLAWRLEGEA
ncbi:2-hydroxychromene-2-carboxylate isomerase [Alphaproteobacteria bacterium LSUCC0684]